MLNTFEPTFVRRPPLITTPHQLLHQVSPTIYLP